MFSAREWLSLKPARLIGALLLAGLSALMFFRSFADGMTVGAWIGLKGYESQIARARFDASVSWYIAWLLPFLGAWLLTKRSRKQTVLQSTGNRPFPSGPVGVGWGLTLAGFLARLLLVYLAAFVFLLLYTEIVRLFASRLPLK